MADRIPDPEAIFRAASKDVAAQPPSNMATFLSGLGFFPLQLDELPTFAPSDEPIQTGSTFAETAADTDR